ncbi:VOC family protein [Burkholderia sp. Ac-20379]|uniref:VOC family protein n=1 Tax=Burkholderia sp. Ac-20379 TaxID=2703900 RepID=UPI00197FA32D|nr:VOC family protein [Burkholderia sp. Ac-20379]MBN3727899.1 VOC family protein [Burkholderia sp. Ac-20379]
MNFVSTRIITGDMRRLVGFYEMLGLAATWYTDDFAELATPSCTLAIGSQRSMDLFGAGAATPGSNRAAIVEFRVDDVDAAFARLEPHLTDVVQAPVTQPWGNRSVLFRDPDGNLVNLFTPVTEDAIRRLAKA